MRKLWIALTLVLLTLFVVVPPALALDHRTGDVVQVEKGETIDDDLVLGGQSVTIDGTVNGDVFVGATTIFINGTINGNLFASGGTVQINGTVNGSVISVGNQIFVKGRVDRNLVAAAHAILVDQTGSVGHNWIGAADQLQNLGTVERGMTVLGNSVQVAGRVGRELLANVKTLEITPTAVIKGPVTYYSQNAASIASGAQVGSVVHHPANRTNFQRMPWYLSPWKIALKFGGFLLVGLAVLALFPRLRGSFPDLIVRKPWQAPLAGFLALIAIPVAALILMVTVIGLPLGLLTLAAYPVLIYVSQVFLAWAAGRFLADRVAALKGQNWVVVFLVGALLTTVLLAVPVVGGILTAAAIFYGLGGLYFSLVRRGEAA